MHPARFEPCPMAIRAVTTEIERGGGGLGRRVFKAAFRRPFRAWDPPCMWDQGGGVA